ncbi:hypothetical protein, partial [Paenibacillus xylanexedens]|uniref:hypothetical protein n=1 Tax=Paenibacillus xylanexedens TaxID=528191 RepID=UPI001C92EFE8
MDKENGKLEYVVVEGEMVCEVGVDMSSLKEDYRLGRLKILGEEKIEFVGKQFDGGWKGEC